jgi:hypothetical protein
VALDCVNKIHIDIEECHGFRPSALEFMIQNPGLKRPSGALRRFPYDPSKRCSKILQSQPSPHYLGLKFLDAAVRDLEKESTVYQLAR